MNQVLSTIENLGTIHGNFNQRELQDVDLRKILKASVATANSSARQAYSIIVVKDKEVMKKLGYVGSVMLIYCIDFHRQRSLGKFLGFSHPLPGMRDFTTSAIDTSMALQTAVIAAKSLGIESLVTNCIHRGDIKDNFKRLNIPPKACFPLIALVLGYSDEKPKGKLRLDNYAVFHNETYNELNENDYGDIVSFYDTEEMGLTSESQWRKLGFNHYLEWFFSKWLGLKRDKIEGESVEPDPFDDMLRETGFLDY